MRKPRAPEFEDFKHDIAVVFFLKIRMDPELICNVAVVISLKLECVMNCFSACFILQTHYHVYHKILPTYFCWQKDVSLHHVLCINNFDVCM